ncbi:unnamed protein product [Paramecium primaurelia]|uniref:Uncharacterized protein n=1 Tax=Paramecium primaurelia TaxID=5886 RepID=A0A8S1LZD2_PARPR|nr:unnamed protein product [Paramecium primaurelia]
METINQQLIDQIKSILKYDEFIALKSHDAFKKPECKYKKTEEMLQQINLTKLKSPQIMEIVFKLLPEIIIKTTQICTKGNI